MLGGRAMMGRALDPEGTLSSLDSDEEELEEAVCVCPAGVDV